jgi:hypothetical protein
MEPLNRLARVAFTFVMMNYAAVAGLFALGRGHGIWKPVPSRGDARPHE